MLWCYLKRRKRCTPCMRGDSSLSCKAFLHTTFIHITALSPAPLFGSTFNTYATSTSSIYAVMIISYRLVTTSGLKLLEHNAGHSFSVIDYLIAAKFNIVDAEILFWQCISLHHRHSYRCSTEVLECS